MRDFQLPGRSPVRATDAMVATSHPLASLAAIEMLRAGGNAMDAAVTAAAVQAVVEPQSTGIGGDCFVLYSPKGQGAPIAFNGSGRSPSAATLDWYLERGFTAIPETGPHAVTVPGAIDAWCRLLGDHGRKGIDAALAPAIHYAEKGYVVHDRVAWDWEEMVPMLTADEHSARMLLTDGKPPQAGDIHRQPELAESLKRIAANGRAGFYEGPIAEDLVARLAELGGLHTLDDFAATKGDYVEPISVRYRGHDLFQMPPNNQGLTALLMLNILSGFDLAGLDPDGAERLHLEIEAGRLAYRDRDRWIADQDKVDVPVKQLLSPDYAAGLRAAIDPKRAMTGLPDVAFPNSDTVYISVVDKDRNAVSFINSTYTSFGSGVTGPKSGVVLQSRGRSFRLERDHPNVIAPGKRPMHTIMPGMALRDGKVVAPYGVMGGAYQPFGHVHFVTNLVDFGMDPQQALDAPRVFAREGAVEVERGVPESVIDALGARGHRVQRSDEPFGGGQAVIIDWEKGTLTGASDHRKDGCALGY
jgi:gamma-glutamyltranspeptidase/glutathione hydrolase